MGVVSKFNWNMAKGSFSYSFMLEVSEKIFGRMQENQFWSRLL